MTLISIAEFAQEAVTILTGGEPLLRKDIIDTIQYGIGEQVPCEVVWEDAALLRLDKIPAFVRGMVKKKILAHCQKQGIARVTVEVLTEIRKEMPTQKIFGKKIKSPFAKG